jgi:hypothetical protein
MKWIKIEDRLPELGQHILVVCENVRSEINYEVNEPSVVKVEYYKENYFPVVDCDYYEVWANGVTHWQPLPSLPE